MTGKVSSYSTQIVKQVSNNINTNMVKLQQLASEICLTKGVVDGMEGLQDADELTKLEFSRSLSDLTASKLQLITEITNLEIFYKTDLFFGSTGKQKYLNDDDYNKAFTDTDNSKGQSVWSFTKGTNGEQVLVLSKAIVSINTGEKLGYVFLYINPKNISDSLQDIEIGDSADILVFDDSW